MTSRERSRDAYERVSERVGACALRHWVNGLGYRSARRPTTCTPDRSTLSRFNLTHPRYNEGRTPHYHHHYPPVVLFPSSLPLRSLPTSTYLPTNPPTPFHPSSFSPLAPTRRFLSSPLARSRSLSLSLRASLDRRRYSITDTFRISMHPSARALPRRKRVYRFIKPPFVRQITFPGRKMRPRDFFPPASINPRRAIIP